MRFYYHEQALLLLALFVTFFYSWRACADPKQVPVRIEEIQHHRGSFSPEKEIEAGTCMFYCCDALPHIVYQCTTKNNIEEHQFVLHNTSLSNEKSMRKAEDLNRAVTEPYTLSIKNIKNKEESTVVVSVTGPKGMFSVTHKPWEQKNRNKKGVIFYVYNQGVIDALRTKNEPVLRTVSLQKNYPRIFIDCGHGGSDTGAVGFGNIQEKDICLCVGKHVAGMLCDLGYDVIISRMTDCDVPLDERTSRANSSHADLFVSIHANASPNSSSHGIETFCLTPTLFSEKNIFADLHKAKRIEQSKQLAHRVQHSIFNEASLLQKNCADRGVKYTVSHILAGTHMPTILVELGFVTHQQEAQLLASRTYQHSLARGITQGIHTYCALL